MKYLAIILVSLAIFSCALTFQVENKLESTSTVSPHLTPAQLHAQAAAASLHRLPTKKDCVPQRHTCKKINRKVKTVGRAKRVLKKKINRAQESRRSYHR